MPDGPERQKQDQKIRQDVDSARNDEVEICVNAGALNRLVPRSVYGAALEDDRQYIGEVEADVQPDEGLNEPEHKAALGGHEDTLELKEDREFRCQDCWRVKDPVDVKQLG